MNDFVSDIQAIRERARRHLEEGAVTPSYGADRDVVIRPLNEALATELVCTPRYKRHYFTARGLISAGVAAEFLEHANEEQVHAIRSRSASSNSAESPTSHPIP